MKLSICSVCSDENLNGASHTQYANYLNFNLELSKNTDIDFEWVVTNSINPYPRIVPLQFEYIELDPFFKQHKLDHNFQLSTPLTGWSWWPEGMSLNSVEHGINLSNSLKHVSPDSEFVLLLDPDFYIVPPLHAVINFMEDKKLAFFGASYALSKAPVIRDFPVAFCLFINRKMIDISSLDLTTGYGDYVNENMYPDTGYKVYAQYKENKEIYDIAIPTIDPEDCRFKKHHSFKHTTKTMLNWKNKIGNKPDEYWYNDEIFGIHTRAKLNSRKLDYYKKEQKIRQQIKTIGRFVRSLREEKKYTLKEYS